MAWAPGLGGAVAEAGAPALGRAPAAGHLAVALDDVVAYLEGVVPSSRFTLPATFPSIREKLMGLTEWFQRLVQKDAQHYVYERIPATTQRQDDPVPAVPLEAENHYVRFWLAEMFLKDDRRLFREYVPVVHSTVRLTFGGKPAQELPYIAGPQNIGLGSTLGRGVQLNHALTNLVPFKGGSVSLSMALVAYKSRDFFQGFTSILHDVSGLLNVGQLSATLKIVDSAVDGIQALLGAGEKDVHLVYHEGFGGTAATGGAPLTSGYTAIVRSDARAFPKEQLCIKDSQLCLGRDLESARPLEGYDYMLIRTEAATARDDFLAFDEFAKLLSDAIREGFQDRERGDAVIRTAQIVAWASPDLTWTDKLRVATALKSQYERALGGRVDEEDRPEKERLLLLNHAALEVPAEAAFSAVRSRMKGLSVPLDTFLGAVQQ